MSGIGIWDKHEGFFTTIEFRTEEEYIKWMESVEKAKKLDELVEWLKSEKYLIDEHSTTMTEEFEREHKWELSRNCFINKTLNKIENMLSD